MNRSTWRPGDLVSVPKSVRLYETMITDDTGGGSFIDKENSYGYASELALVVGTWPATLLLIIGDNPRWRWIWPGSERLLVKETSVA